MLILIDHFDSFTYNLEQLIAPYYKNLRIIRYDELNLTELKKLNPKGVILSPGPKSPKDYPLSIEIIKSYGGQIPLLGVCLGYQMIGELFGARLIKAPLPVHGKIALISHKQKGIFIGIKNPMQVARYHSLLLEKSSFTQELELSASYNNLAMALEHKKKKHLYGVQFHPESFLCLEGKKLMQNFCELI